MPTGELVIHEDHALDPGAVVFREKVPAQKLNPQGAKIAGSGGAASAKSSRR
jgi:hypothetical protein